MSKIVLNAQYNLSEPNMINPYGLFCPNNSPKPKYIQFTIIYDQGKNQIARVCVCLCVSHHHSRYDLWCKQPQNFRAGLR